MLTEIFEEIFTYWWAPLNSPCFEIAPLVYNAGSSVVERVGSQSMSQILAVVENTNYTLVQKRNLLKIGFGLDEWEAMSFVPNVEVDNSANITIEENDPDTGRPSEGSANSGKPSRHFALRNVFKRGRKTKTNGRSNT